MHSALWELTYCRLREFFREPAAIFWVYGFPLLIAVALGIAFREKPIEKMSVDLYAPKASEKEIQLVKTKLLNDERIQLHEPGEEWKTRLRSGKTDVVLQWEDNSWQIWHEPHRAESTLARTTVELLLTRSPEAPTLPSPYLQETGSRYIDFLLPGLIGMNIMGGGLFGIGFIITDMRVRKLLKRYLATPMRRRDFMLSLLFSRLIFMVPEIFVLLMFGILAFGIRVQGDWLSLLLFVLLGSFAFGGIGLLVASRAKTIETVSGLMNLVMLPMWVLSGVFFSSDRFPDVMQPVIQILPLTALNNALRGIMIEGRSILSLSFEVLILMIWGMISFVVALKIFRWS
jgi:ABC-type multidrug transport system permease subunit